MSVATANRYDLLGNDVQDENEIQKPITKIVEKASTHTTKRNADGIAPTKTLSSTTAGRTQRFSGNEGVFHDRAAGSQQNREKGTEEFPRGGRGGRGRGGRSAAFKDDRHARSIPSGGSEKTAAHAWGTEDGKKEKEDEEAGEEMAKIEKADVAAEGEAIAEGEVKEEEPEDKHVSYADYLAQQAEKKLGLEDKLQVRPANEGKSIDDLFKGAKPLSKDNGEDYFAGSGGKTKRERERKVKQVVDIDQRYVEHAERPRGGRGGRGGARRDSGRGRGEGRGGPRGDYRGGREGREGREGRDGRDARDGPRADYRENFRGRDDRGGAQSTPAHINTKDESAFPSLGK